ncbi:hypothetical protein H7X46_00150 [Pseudonocardia sp. C8]|nr:hypothetical protein [Pseudonocardia sp. C8]
MERPDGGLPDLGRAETPAVRAPRSSAGAAHRPRQHWPRQHGHADHRGESRRARRRRHRPDSRAAALRALLNEIDPSKDLDSLGIFAPRLACATADGIVRIAEPYLDRTQQVAVVGSSGFVGSGVVALLRDAGHDPILLNAGDDLHRVRDADVVLSTTGVPGLLTGEHLHSEHRLVVDSSTPPHTARAATWRPRPPHSPSASPPYPAGSGRSRWPSSPNASSSRPWHPSSQGGDTSDMKTHDPL